MLGGREGRTEFAYEVIPFLLHLSRYVNRLYMNETQGRLKGADG